MAGSEGPEERLVAALVHEIGNVLAAIRLSSHLMAQDLGEKAAAYARQIDDLAAHAGALLAHLRPLSNGSRGSRMVVGVAGLLAGMEHVVSGVGTGASFSLDVSALADEARIDVDPERLHNALVLLALGALVSAGADGTVRLSAVSDGDWIRLALEDDGAPIEPEAGGAEPRGRTLAAQVVGLVLARDGGQLELPDPARGGQLILQLPRA